MVVHELLIAPVDDVDVVADERGRYPPDARLHLGKIDRRAVLLVFDRALLSLYNQDV